MAKIGPILLGLGKNYIEKSKKLPKKKQPSVKPTFGLALKDEFRKGMKDVLSSSFGIIGKKLGDKYLDNSVTFKDPNAKDPEAIKGIRAKTLPGAINEHAAKAQQVINTTKFASTVGFRNIVRKASTATDDITSKLSTLDEVLDFALNAPSPQKEVEAPKEFKNKVEQKDAEESTGSSLIDDVINWVTKSEVLGIVGGTLLSLFKSTGRLVGGAALGIAAYGGLKYVWESDKAELAKQFGREPTDEEVHIFQLNKQHGTGQAERDKLGYWENVKKNWLGIKEDGSDFISSLFGLSGEKSADKIENDDIILKLNYDFTGDITFKAQKISFKKTIKPTTEDTTENRDESGNLRSKADNSVIPESETGIIDVPGVGPVPAPVRPKTGDTSTPVRPKTGDTSKSKIKQYPNQPDSDYSGPKKGEFDSSKAHANFMQPGEKYGRPGQNLTKVETEGGHKFTVHKEAAEAFKGAIEDLEKAGAPLGRIGGYDPRPGGIKGSGRMSQHSMGNAMDLFSQRGTGLISKEGMEWIRSHPREWKRIKDKWGLKGGEDFGDIGHIEWTGRKPWLENKSKEEVKSNPPPVVPPSKEDLEPKAPPVTSGEGWPRLLPKTPDATPVEPEVKPLPPTSQVEPDQFAPPRIIAPQVVDKNDNAEPDIADPKRRYKSDKKIGFGDIQDEATFARYLGVAELDVG